MTQSRPGQFEVKPLPIVGGYNVARFKQLCPEDTANHYMVKQENGKRQAALFPVLGRAHINSQGYNQLIFGSEPRGIFKTINYLYVVVGNQIYRYDSQFNPVNITANAVGSATNAPLNSLNTPIYFTFLVVNQIVFACFVDDVNIYVYVESGLPGNPLALPTPTPNQNGNLYVVTDPHAPGNVKVNGVLQLPGFIATFGNRITVSVANSAQFFLSVVNLLNPDGTFDPLHAFSIGYNAVGPVAGAAVFAQATGFVRQMGVLNNTLYVFCDYVTDVWSNNPAYLSDNVYFPWRQNSTYNWNFGIANPSSLDIDFGWLVFLARNSDGLLQFMRTQGGQPEVMSSKAIDTLLQRYTNQYGANNPFLVRKSNGFLYQYENTILYRMSGGSYSGTQILDQELTDNSIEFCFETQTWHRCIEMNGERNKVNLHVFFNFMHLVTLTGEGTIYNLSGQFYYNESRNLSQTNAQAPDAYIAYPMRYERVTPIISEEDYAEFETEYAEIDFVFGDSNISYSLAPFSTVQFIIDEVPGADGSPQYMIAENPGADGNPIFIITDGSTNEPAIGELSYNTLFKPSIELRYSDDGGISYNSADIREFSQQGAYIWKMRWYQLGPSRNRCYKLICVSPVPITILGGVMNVRRISGGAN